MVVWGAKQDAGKAASRFVSSRSVRISGVASSHEQHTSQFPGGSGAVTNRIIGISLKRTIIRAIEPGGYYSDLLEKFKANQLRPQSSAVVSGVVTGVRLLLVMVLQGVLRAVKMSGYWMRLGGSGTIRGVQNRPTH
jgi:hypothetical protein